MRPKGIGFQDTVPDEILYYRYIEIAEFEEGNFFCLNDPGKNEFPILVQKMNSAGKCKLAIFAPGKFH